MNPDSRAFPVSQPPERFRVRHYHRAWTAHCLVALFFAVLVGTVFRPWLKPFRQPQRGGPELHFRAGDLTPLFSVWTQVTARSLFERGEFPLWSDHIYCGEPFFAKPQIGVISLTTLLCLVLPAQIVATWTFLLHLWIAGMSAYALGLELMSFRIRVDSKSGSLVPSQSRPRSDFLSAACGGVAFMLSGLMAEHTMIGHGPIVLVACWTPLVLRLIVRTFVGSSPVRSGTLAGLLVAVQLLAGGETMFLYNAIAGGMIGLAWILFGGRKLRLAARLGTQTAAVQSGANNDLTPTLAGRFVRVVVAGFVIGLVGFGLSAVKVLPGLELMPVSNRAGGLTLADASGMIIEFREPALLRVLLNGVRELFDLRSLLPITLILATTGLLSGLRSSKQRWLALSALMLMVLGVVIAHSSTVFGLLWDALPLFRFQRIPQRALVLTYLGVSMLVSIGVSSVLGSRCFRRTENGQAREPGTGRKSNWNGVPLLAGVGLLIGVSLESYFALPELPPTADIRKEIHENQILNYLAAQPGQFRIHAVESNDRNWGIEHVTVPLGLSNLAGWDHLWLLEYLGAEGTMGRDVRPFLTASYQALHPARFWGLMNVRYVTSMLPRAVPGLKFIEKFTVSSSSQPAKSAGPYLYENEECMPRAWVVPRCILVSGGRAERLEATYKLLDLPQFDPRRIVVLTDEEHGTKQHRSHDAELIPSSWLLNSPELAEQQPRLRAQNRWLLMYSIETPGLWEQPDELAEMIEELSRRDTEPESPVVETYGPHFVRLRLSGQIGFLVLAEKFAHFPGWHARTAAGPRLLLRANGVASAITLDGTEQWVELSYWPPGLTAGLILTLISFILVPFLAWCGDRLVPFTPRPLATPLANEGGTEHP